MRVIITFVSVIISIALIGFFYSLPIWLLFLVPIVSSVLSIILSRFIKADGDLKIEDSTCYLNLSLNEEAIKKRKYLTIKVVHLL